MTDYLLYFPKPFLDDIVSNRCIPIVGSGFSRNAILNPGKIMPVWEELGKSIGKMIPNHQYFGAIDAISAFEHEFSRVKLVEELNKLLHINTAQPGPAHTSFCRLPFELVCTSNFDFLLERGYEIVGRYCRPIIEEEQLSISLDGPVVTLLKFHGDLHHPTRMVMTEDDYSLFISQYPLVATFLANILISKTAWFIGYSLEDPDFRLLWQVIGDRLGKLRRLAYTIKVFASAHDIARFERRGVKVINIPGNQNNYSTILEEVFNQLREYWANNTAEITVKTEEDVFAELILPKGAKTRICFFLIPRDVVTFYRKRVFPVAEEHGFIPISVSDIMSSGDSIAAKLSAIIDKSEYLILDISTRSTMLEAGMVFAQRHDLENILVIKDPDADLPLEWLSRVKLIRPSDLSNEMEEFLYRIENWFINKSEKMQPELDQEPRRLLELKEYRSAIISAIALLEYQLRKRLSRNKDDDRISTYSLSILLKQAEKMGWVNQTDSSKLRSWIAVRNEAIHKQGRVNGKVAKQIVKYVYSIIERLEREY